MKTASFELFHLQTFVGILSRETLADTLPISAGFGRVLQILVENQGRNNYGLQENEFKGIIGDAFLSEQPLKNWNITGFPFESFVLHLNELLVRVEQEPHVLNKIGNRTSEYLINGPVIFEGIFDINEVDIYDTFIDPSGWGKVEYIFSFSLELNKTNAIIIVANKNSFILTFANQTGIYSFKWC